MTAHRRIGAILIAFVMSLVLTIGGASGAHAGTSPPAKVIVQVEPGAQTLVTQQIEALGGEILSDLWLIDSISATVGTADIPALSNLPGVRRVTPDTEVNLTSWNTGGKRADGSLERITTTVIDADAFWRRGVTGAGIDVAIIDSGVTPVDGLATPGKVVNGPDLSFEAGHPSLNNLDSYGHGTHLAGIIAGADAGIGAQPSPKDVKRNFAGVAPGARIVNVKVADGAGAADVSQVIAGIQWVVSHRNDPGLNIRVLNLAFGTDGMQDYRIDPLAYAVERAWDSGIVVVTAAGNDGAGLRNPAYDPFVLTVGSLDTQGTPGTGDDHVSDFSNCGTVNRPVDVLAPGVSVESLRVPGSLADTFYPDARVGDRFIRGTGTSQAAAMVAGGVALLLNDRPSLSPDEVKAIISESAKDVRRGSTECGQGVLDLAAAARTEAPADATQLHDRSDGSGSIEASRGSFHVALDGVPVQGEVDITGAPWTGGTWSGGTWSGGTWSGGTWSGGTWSGGTWSGGTWSGGTWSGGTWSGGTWSGGTWSGGTWSGGTWSGGTWSGGTWSGGTWSGGTWSGGTWSSSVWSGLTWG